LEKFFLAFQSELSAIFVKPSKGRKSRDSGPKNYPEKAQKTPNLIKMTIAAFSQKYSQERHVSTLECCSHIFTESLSYDGWGIENTCST
jgi:hypothetical protein